MKCWVCIDTGQLDSAAVLVADVIDQAERHGLEQFRVIGAILQASVSGLAALGAEELEPTRLAHRIASQP